MKSLEIKKCISILIGLIFLTDLAILSNIPFLRQVLGFLFLTILPGLLILQILKLNKIGTTEKFVLSVGLSISFLMFFGLLLNNLSLGLGYLRPLGTIPLLISFNVAFVVLAVIRYKVDKTPIYSLPNLNLSTSEKAFLIAPILFPALSIFGMHVMNMSDNNIVLMLLLFLIPIYVALVCFFNQKFPDRLYPIVIFLIGVSLVLMFALRSNHIIGVDRHEEYYFFMTTLNNLHWSIFGHSTLDACLAISLLPAIYQSFLNTNSEYLCKVLIPVIFSISPLIIYIISKKYVGETYAFLASFFFMAQHLFVSFPGGRTNLAIFFFALAMMTLFSDKIDPLKKRILFIVFIASCMVSHYSTTYIFFFVMVGMFIGMEMLSKKYTFKKVISLTLVILFFAFIFFWYSQVTEAAFNAGVGFVEDTFSNLNKFFVEESRSSNVEAMLGGGIWQKGIPHKIEFVLTWLTFAFIGIGVVTLIRRYKEMSFPELNLKKADFLKDKFEVGYFVIALICSGLLVAVVLTPYITVGYSLDRSYLFGIIVLSSFFAIGGIMVAKYLNKLLTVLPGKTSSKNAVQVRAYLIILLVIIPYFLSVTGVTYQVFGVPRAITLNSEGEEYNSYYVHDQASYGAKWLKEHSDEKVRIYGDYRVRRLLSQGEIRRALYAKSLIENKKDIKKGYIYLQYTGVVNKKLLDVDGQWHNMSEYYHLFVEKDKIYNNGGSEVYFKP